MWQKQATPAVSSKPNAKVLWTSVCDGEQEQWNTSSVPPSDSDRLEHTPSTNAQVSDEITEYPIFALIPDPIMEHVGSAAHHCCTVARLLPLFYSILIKILIEIIQNLL